MLQLTYGLPTVRGDVLHERMSLDETGISIQMYRDTNRYPYGEGLVVYDSTAGRTHPLRSHEEALRYFQGVTTRTPVECRNGLEGFGIPIF
jgi:hypothetical protein